MASPLDLATTTFANGLTVASVRLPGFRTACIGAYVRVGSRFEPAHLAGISHFFEHMAFKGTRTRDAYRIALDAERAGAYMNAFTAKDHTGYYLHLPGDQAATAVELVADVLRASSFPRAELERERHVVLQEMIEADDDAESVAQDQMDLAAFARHPLGQPILGKRAVVRTIKRRDFTDYLAQHYCGSNMVVVGVGAIEHRAFRAQVKRHFGDLPRGARTPTEPAAYRGGYRAKPLDFAQTWIALGWPTSGRDAPEFVRYELLAELLGGGTAAPLFQTLRERHGLAYAVSATIEGFEDTGLLQIVVGVAPRNVARAIDLIGEVLTRPIDADNLERAVQQLRAHTMARLERPQSLAETIALALLSHGKVPPLEARLDRIGKTPLAEIDALRRKLIAQRPSLAIVGRAGRADHYSRLQKGVGNTR